MRYITVFIIAVNLCGCEETPEWQNPDQYLEKEGRYCYETLGGVDCYTQPIKRCTRKPLGYEGPPPPTHIYE